MLRNTGEHWGEKRQGGHEDPDNAGTTMAFPAALLTARAASPSPMTLLPQPWPAPHRPARQPRDTPLAALLCLPRSCFHADTPPGTQKYTLLPTLG
ncbi:hypothetical protein E2C01_011435 [Portunus trituberculatus]|uniref:Uncharacterized protein n=1 Tax=Portunus trituberculatus TaxID=210409 RepID=A0A5B7DBE1_PORTR|nr:hypothetical protein [Portunus trituberculatus]